MKSPSRVVHVDIHGQRYAVRSELEPSYVAELAAFLDDKMRLAASEIQSVDSLRIAIVAALNVADELFHSRAESAEGQWNSRAIELERLVDAALGVAADRKIAANE